MASKKKDDEKVIDHTNYRESAQEAIQKYWSTNHLLDGLFWGKIIAHYEQELGRYEKLAKQKKEKTVT